jgi:D-3-phosphoglycerate dehydrogenase
MPKVLITCMHLARHFETYRPQFEALGVTAVIPPLGGQQFSASEMAGHIAGVDAIIAGDDAIDASVLDTGKSTGLKAVVKWGIGTDGIDKPHAAKIGLPVFNTPGVFGEEVADLAMSHLLMLSRQTHRMDASVREGGWLKAEGRTLSGLTAGVVGLGSIGQAIARRAGAFGMKVIAHDIHPFEAAELEKMGVLQVSLDDLLAEADVVFVACALTAENRHLIGRRAFEQMKPGVFLINVSRGPLVDEAALTDALASGKVAAAGLDVFEAEPLPSVSPLRAFGDRCTFSTHNGSNTREAVARINQMTTDIVFDVLGLKPAGFTPNRVA